MRFTPSVSPLSIYKIEHLANTFLEVVQPDALCRPVPLDINGMLHGSLSEYGIEIAPGAPEEMGKREAFTDFSSYPEVEIVLCEEQWDALHNRQLLTWRARSSVAHEIGHAVLHAEQLFAWEPTLVPMNAPVKPPAYLDPEWQAWVFAGCILMPRKLLKTIDELLPEAVSEIYDVSPEMATVHLSRLSKNKLI